VRRSLANAGRARIAPTCSWRPAAAYLAATGGYDGALARFPPDVRGWLRD
jgi:hypothetical protein